MDEYKHIEREVLYSPEDAQKTVQKFRQYYKEKRIKTVVCTTKGAGNKHVVYVYRQRRGIKSFDPLSVDEIRQIIRAGKNAEERVFLTTLAYSGRRISEVVGPWGIRPIDITTGESIIRFIILKRKERKSQLERVRIVVPHVLITVLQHYIAEKSISPDRPIFKRTRQWANVLLRNCEKSVGRKLWPHLFRHSYAANLAKKAQTPADASMIQDQLQHTDVNITYHYIREFNKTATQELVEDVFGEKK